MGGGSIEVANLDADPFIDILTISGDNRLSWHKFYETGNTVEHLITENNTSGGHNDIEVADIDGDGDLDIITTVPSENKIKWNENKLVCGAGYFDCNGVCGGENETCIDECGVLNGDGFYGECAGNNSCNNMDCRGNVLETILWMTVGNVQILMRIHV